jgi:hypothetical protein
MSNRFLKFLYFLIGSAAVLFYAAAAWGGWEFTSGKQDKSGPPQRGSAGSRYYHGGYRGGK